MAKEASRSACDGSPCERCRSLGKDGHTADAVGDAPERQGRAPRHRGRRVRRPVAIKAIGRAAPNVRIVSVAPRMTGLRKCARGSAALRARPSHPVGTDPPVPDAGSVEASATLQTLLMRVLRHAATREEGQGGLARECCLSRGHDPRREQPKLLLVAKDGVARTHACHDECSTFGNHSLCISQQAIDEHQVVLPCCLHPRAVRDGQARGR